MDPERLRALITESLMEIAPNADTRRLDPAVSFHDQFEIDSVDFMNLMLSLEQKLGIHIPEADYPKLSSLNGCVHYLDRPLAAKPQAGQAAAR